LPRAVREEALAIAQAKGAGFRAPVHALHYYYKLSHLVDETTDGSFENDRPPRSDQMELPLRAAGGV
jgi:hypothetical protein